MGMFVISKRHNGGYKFVFTSRRGKPVFTSIACKQKSDCEMIIHAIRDHIEVFTITRKCTVSGKFFFRLSKGGLVLATSRQFSTELRLAKGIDETMRNVPEAEILDFSVNEFVFPDVDTSAVETDQA